MEKIDKDLYKALRLLYVMLKRSKVVKFEGDSMYRAIITIGKHTDCVYGLCSLISALIYDFNLIQSKFDVPLTKLIMEFYSYKNGNKPIFGLYWWKSIAQDMKEDSIEALNVRIQFLEDIVDYYKDKVI